MATAKKSTKSASTFSVEMTHTKDTKNTHVFAEDVEGSEIRSLYINKGSFTGNTPESITVTVTSA